MRAFLPTNRSPIAQVCGILIGGGFAESTLSLGVVHLGRCRWWLHDLWLAAEIHDSISRWTGNDHRVFFNRQRAADVAGLYRPDVRGLLAVETGVLIRPSK